MTLLVAVGARVAVAQTAPDLTIEPAMTKGPATAPVTIFEFSDYQ
jgi:hypothetical protein